MENKDLTITNRADFIHSPFRYPGHQIYVLDTLLSLIPDHQSYAEPFCGGASIFFGKTKVKENWLNDIDRELIDTYKVIRDQPEKLVAVLSKEKVSKQRHYYFKEEFTPENCFETAVRWFYLNRTSRLETMSMFWEFDDRISTTPEKWCEAIQECSRKLQFVKLTSLDFEEVIYSAPLGAFLFLAPPYSIHHSSAENKLHKYPFEKESHFRLARILRLNADRIKFLLTYNENEEIREIYSWDNLRVLNLPNKPHQKEEIVIMNY